MSGVERCRIVGRSGLRRLSSCSGSVHSVLGSSLREDTDDSTCNLHSSGISSSELAVNDVAGDCCGGIHANKNRWRLFGSGSASCSSFFYGALKKRTSSQLTLVDGLPKGREWTDVHVSPRRQCRTVSAEFERRSVSSLESLSVSSSRKNSSVAAGLILPPSSTVDARVIHPTAIVHPDAIIGENVEIGAYCTVGQDVKIGDGCTLHPGSHMFGDTQLGENCVLFTGAVVGADIPGRTILGDNNSIGYHAVVGVKCQDLKYQKGAECHLQIGNNNDIREYVSVHRSSKPEDNTFVGNDNLIMGSCHIAHDCKVGNGNILANGTLLGGHVVLEDLVHTGGAVAVHQFCSIGSYSFLAGGSMVDRDVPMFMMVAGDRAELRGLNLEGMRRCGFTNLEVRSIRKAYQRLFMSGEASVGLEERLAELEQTSDISEVPAVGSMLQSIRNCFRENRRGICRFRHWTTSI